MNVRIPGLLRSYTAGAETVALPSHSTLDDALRDLDARFPGLRFRIVDEQQADAVELMIVGALSGG